MTALKYRKTHFAALFSATLAVLVLCGSEGSAAVLTFHADLDGFQVVPPNASPGFGSGDFTLDDSTGVVTVTFGSYQDLLGGATAVHIHGPAGAGANAAVVINLTLDTPGQASGTFSGNGTLAGANIAAMIAGNTYVDVHSQVFPGGEVRGQIEQVPEPSSLALVALSAIGVAAFALGRRLYG